MYFEVDKSWEIDASFVNALYGDNKRLFNVVQLGYNPRLILLDAEAPDQDGDFNYWVRFLFSEIRTALSFIKNSNFGEIKLAMVSRRDEYDGGYIVSDILRVEEAKDRADQVAYILTCRNGKEYIDSFLTDSRNDLTIVSQIFNALSENT